MHSLHMFLFEKKKTLGGWVAWGAGGVLPSSAQEAERPHRQLTAKQPAGETNKKTRARDVAQWPVMNYMQEAWVQSPAVKNKGTKLRNEVSNEEYVRIYSNKSLISRHTIVTFYFIGQKNWFRTLKELHLMVSLLFFCKNKNWHHCLVKDGIFKINSEIMLVVIVSTYNKPKHHSLPHPPPSYS